MIVTMKLLNKPEQVTINNRIYDYDSYMKAMTTYIEEKRFVYIYDFTLYADYKTGNCDMTRFCSTRPDFFAGRIIKLNDDFTLEFDIIESYYEAIKDTINSYYIMIRSVGEFDNVSHKTRITRIAALEIHNDPACVVKEDKNGEPK